MFDYVLLILDMDARWRDYQTFRYSLPHKWGGDVDIRKDCEHFNESHPKIEFAYDFDTIADRGTQKFKLLQVKVCKL